MAIRYDELEFGFHFLSQRLQVFVERFVNLKCTEKIVRTSLVNPACVIAANYPVHTCVLLRGDSFAHLYRFSYTLPS